MVVCQRRVVKTDASYLSLALADLDLCSCTTLHQAQGSAISLLIKGVPIEGRYLFCTRECNARVSIAIRDHRDTLLQVVHQLLSDMVSVGKRVEDTVCCT